YVATGDTEFLQPYNAILSRFTKDLATLRAAAGAGGDGGAAQVVEARAATVLQALAELRAAVADGPTGPLQQDLLVEKQTMDTLRDQVDNLAAEPAAIVAAHR